MKKWITGIGIFLAGVTVGYLVRCAYTGTIILNPTCSQIIVSDHMSGKRADITDTNHIQQLHTYFVQPPTGARSRLELVFRYHLQFYSGDTCSGVVYYDPTGWYRTDLILQKGDEQLDGETNQNVLKLLDKQIWK